MIDFTAGYYWEFPCKLIALPEYFLQGVTTSGKGEKKKKQRMGVAIEIPSKEIDILGQKAKEYGLYLACGGIVEKVPDWPDYWFNTGIIIAPTGEVVLRYRKWHVPASLGSGTSPHDMFDKYRQKFGGDLKSLFPVVDTEIGKLGAFIGYDSFTPEVARALAFNGGEEYELVFTYPPDEKPIIKKALKSAGCELINIGFVSKKKEIVYRCDNKLIPIKRGGWNHFMKAPSK